MAARRRRVARRAILVAAITASVLAAGGRSRAWAEAAGCADLSSPFQTLTGCDLHGANIGGVAALAASNLRLINLNQATIGGQAALLGANLRFVNLNQAAISGPEALVEANLEGVNLNGVTITQPAVLVAADLRLVNLNRSTIAGQGDLLAANLRGANLHDATISGTGALTGADLSYADLQGAAVTGASALFDARYSHTICPDGSISDRDGGTCAGHLTAASDDDARGAAITGDAVRGLAARSGVVAAAVPVGGGGGGGGGGTPPLTPPPGQTLGAPGVASLGGLDLDQYCAAHGYAYSQVNGPIVGPDQAFQWYCVGGVRGTSSINMQNACAFQYPGAGSLAFVEDPNNAYTWVCVVPTTSSSGGYVETAGGYTALTLPAELAVVTPNGTLLAESGSLATGGAVYLLVGPDGTIDYGTPDSGFEVAESGSLANGGAV